MTRPFIKGKFSNSAELADVPATANVGNEFNYYDGIAPATAIDKSEGGLPQDRPTMNSAFQLLSKFAVGIQNGEFTLPVFDTRMTVAPMTGYSSDTVMYYNDVANSCWMILKSTKNNNVDDYTQNPSYIGTSWTQIGIIPYNLSVLSTPALMTGQIIYGLFKTLPSASYVWGDNGRQQLNNASVNYSNLVNSIIGGILPYDTIANWDAAYAANPDNAVPFWGYDSVNDIVIIPNIPRGYALTASGSLANMGTVLQNAAPNITATFRNDGANASSTGCITTVTRSWGNRDAANGYYSANPFTFNASLSNSAYGRDSTTRVRNDQVQMRVMFYIGAEINPQEANQITAAGVLSDVADLSSITGQGTATPQIDYVVASYYAADGSSWYRQYYSGWVEQGGTVTTSTGDYSITLPITMANNTYCSNLTPYQATSTTDLTIRMLPSSTTTTLIIKTTGNGASIGFGAKWEVKGLAAA